MTKEETAKIIYILMSTYSAAYKNISAEKTNALIQTWNAVMADYSYSDVEQGLYVYMSTDTSGFPPAPGQVIDKIRMLHPEEPEMDALEAWILVEKAVRNSAYNAVEEFKKLPAMIQKAVRRPELLKEWAVMEEDEFRTIEQSHFIRVYDTVRKREKEYQRIPEKMRALIETTINQMPQLPEIEPEKTEIYEPKEFPQGVEDQIEELRQEFGRRAI